MFDTASKEKAFGLKSSGDGDRTLPFVGDNDKSCGLAFLVLLSDVGSARVRSD